MIQTSPSADTSEETSYSLCDGPEEHQIAKRYYKCIDNHEFKRQMFPICPPRYQGKSRKTLTTSAVVIF